MNKNLERLSSLVVGLYTWTIAVFFGGTMLDIVYFNLLKDGMSASESTLIYSEVSDVLLCIGTAAILAAIGAIIFSWNVSVARNLFIASLLVVVFEFITPVFFLQFTQNAPHLNIGPWLRIALGGLASLFAFIGQHTYYCQK